MRAQLIFALDELEENKEVKVIIIRSNIKNVFCAGADIKELEKENQVFS